MLASGVETAGRTLGLALVVAASASCKYDELPPIEIPGPMPCELMVSEVGPAVISEGMGVGGSRPALIVISGQNLVNDNTIVAITAAGGLTRELRIVIDAAKIEVGARGTHLSVPVILPVDPSLMANENVVLDVKVEQGCSEGRVSGTVPGKLTLEGLGELTDAAMLLQSGTREFSQINVESGFLPTSLSGGAPIVLRSRSSVKIVPDILLNANGRVGGPAGGTGGQGGTSGSPGTPGTGPMPGLTSGAAGGFDTTDPGLNTLNNLNRSSGGAGGSGGLIGSGGNGGGGGGSIEISAGGDLQVGKISARGAFGAVGSGGSNGGGGSGGVILLRAGGTLTAGDLDVRSLGTGARGRARYDAGGSATVNPGELGTDHLRGPMFSEVSFAAHSTRPELRVAAEPLTDFKYFVITREGQPSGLFNALSDGSGSARITLSSDLSPGLNQICLITNSGTQASETSNCAHIAYLP